MHWSLGVKRKEDPIDVYVEGSDQFVSAPGTDVTPWSNVVGKDIKTHRLVHRASGWHAGNIVVCLQPGFSILAVRI